MIRLNSIEQHANESMKQSPNAVVMVRPHYFQPNPQTLADNSFQQKMEDNCQHVSDRALKEVSDAVNELRQHGVMVHLFEDKTKETPDSVFPNNWFTTHANGQLGIFPMYCENRRKERSSEIIDYLKEQYHVEQVVDYSNYEQQQIFLEGTGSMVLDNVNRIAYAVKSKRMNQQLFSRFCADFNYEGIAFDACDENGVAVYHTNVMMCVGTEFALIGLSLITDYIERDYVCSKLENSHKEVIELSSEQIAQFAGNALELSTDNGPLLVVSSTAYQSLTQDQIRRISRYVKILPLNVTTIEKAGGSIRCMLAGIHLPAKETCS